METICEKCEEDYRFCTCEEKIDISLHSDKKEIRSVHIYEKEHSCTITIHFGPIPE